MGITHRVEQGAEDVDHVIHRQHRAARVIIIQQSLERGALDVLHDHIVLVALGVEIEDLHDVGVMELGHGLRLTPKAAYEVGLVGEVGMQDFDSDPAVEVGVVAVVDLGHAAAAQAFEHLIFA